MGRGRRYFTARMEGRTRGARIFDSMTGGGTGGGGSRMKGKKGFQGDRGKEGGGLVTTH